MFKDQKYLQYIFEQGFERFSCIYDEPDTLIYEQNRREIIDVLGIVSNILDYDEEDLFTALTNRTTKHVIEISKEEFVRTLLEWVVAEKSYGFHFDW